MPARFEIEIRDFEMPESEETIQESTDLIEEAIRDKIERTIEESPVVIVTKKD